MPVNIEIKARCQDPSAARSILMDLKADHRGTDHQVDTYFNVKNGRLKLREGNIENNLIFYKRSDQEGPKRSDVVLYPASKDQGLKNILKETLGLRTVVDKKRDIYFIENVKFHIDNVTGLGSFIEIEAIGEQGEEKELDRLCRYYMKLLGVEDSQLVSRSYSDLLLENDEH